jgi:hypothetical protein
MAMPVATIARAPGDSTIGESAATAACRSMPAASAL